MSRQRHTIIYDGGCGLCAHSMRRLQAWDWLALFRFVPKHDIRAIEFQSRIPPQALETAIHCVTVGGRILKAGRALRFIFLRIPLLCSAGLLMWIPGVLQMSEKLYDRVSRNRTRFSCALKLPAERPGTDDAVAMQQSKKNRKC